MNTNVEITPNEAISLHELLAFKNLCAAKASAMVALVKDEELKSLMKQDLKTTQDHIRDLVSLINLSDCLNQ